MTIILDVFVLAVIAISVLVAYKKGLIKTLFSLVGGLIAVVLAINLSVPVANWLDEQFVGPAVRKTVLTAVNGSKLMENYDQALASIDVVDKLQEMPESLRSFLETLNVDVDEIIASAEKTQEDSTAAKEQLIDSIALPVSEMISKAIALIGLMVLFFVVLFVASRLLDTVFRLLPFGATLNKTGGLILGALRALSIVFVLGAVVYGLACGNILISLEELEHTVLLRWINSVNPILSLFTK